MNKTHHMFLHKGLSLRKVNESFKTGIAVVLVKILLSIVSEATCYNAAHDV